MGQFKKVISATSTHHLITDLTTLFKRYRFGFDFIGEDFCDLLPELLYKSTRHQARGSGFSSMFNELLADGETPALVSDAFNMCRHSTEGKYLFSQFVMPSITLSEYQTAVTEWHRSCTTTEFQHEFEYLRACTEQKLRQIPRFDSRAFDSLSDTQKARLTYSQHSIITDIVGACIEVSRTHQPRILNIGSGTGTEMPGTCKEYTRFTHEESLPPVFFNVDSSPAAIRSSSTLSEKLGIPASHVTTTGESFTQTEGLTGVLMPNPNIVLVRHFFIGHDKHYPYVPLQQLSGTNGIGLVTFYMGNECDEFIEDLHILFTPQSLPNYERDMKYDISSGMREYVVRLTQFPEKSFVYKDGLSPR